jgi:formate/nitrite transporter FocA (FNT family)
MRWRWNRLSDILRGKRAMTTETALRLGRYLGTESALWLNMQAQYDLAVAERDYREQIAQEVTVAVAAKMNAPVLSLVARAVLCNWLVCLAIWMSARTTSDAAKCILIFWCLFGFIGTGYEHSVANMTLLIIALWDGTRTP